MRFNDPGIEKIVDEIKNNWQYLRLADNATNTYDGSEYSDPLQTLTLESVSVTDNIITLIYRLGVLDLNGDTINMSGLATNDTDDTVHSNEEFLDVEKDDLTQWRWVYKIRLLR
jgi:hypothetical protein